jgi:predicted ester cyclase
MKNYLFIVALTFLLCLSFACQDKAAMAELEKYKAQAAAEKQNEVVVRQFFAAIDAQDFTRFGALFAPDATIHGARPQEDVTAENAAQLLKPFYKAFPDLTHSIKDIFSKGDKVVARILIQATHETELMGITPAGNRVEYYQVAIFQIVDGKIKEGWRVTDSLGMMQQLGMELKPRLKQAKNPTSVQDIETEANRILMIRSKTHILANVIFERGVPNFYFTFITASSREQLMEDLVACAEAVSKLTSAATKASSRVYLKESGKVFSYLYSKDCREAMKLGSIQQQGVYLIRCMHSIN